MEVTISIDELRLMLDGKPVENVEKKQTVKRAAKKQTAKKSGKYEPGTVFVRSYGYDMTLVDFFEVTRSTEKTVWVRRIKSEIVDETGFMSGHVIPAEPHEPDSDGEKMLRIKDSGWVGSGFDLMHEWNGSPCYFNHMD